ncbi:flagellar basal-body rod protein FlgG [Ramlibacter sp. USB13]|uniref:Flagellar basal-body rod protein FlgG n=1 Tax=Ramlibacter cellulosilyticus TaxID=2764187 RepID=A0A923MU62_9BURK|nr:flagellar basal-body rod protein FlgG [Ramlibacter cellulosilyticus]MBC5785091.1 flagellar basal-body rod protein FlgG [Ramlibacter cellulosilyticus]
MFDALYIGATGMHAQQAHVDAIANNLANVNTAGFKKTRIGFSDLVAGGVVAGQRAGAGENGAFVNASVGVGVQALSPGKVFAGGDLKKTESPMDVAILGEGFLELAMPDGSRAYARGGTFKVNADGLLSTQAGVPLKPNLSIPENAEAITVSATGRVQVRLPGQSTPVEAGQLELVRFANPQGLLAQGGNVYRATDASGEPIAARAGEDGAGTLAQGFLEGSNVKLVEEMVDLLVAQRAYEASVKVVQASDEMLGLINGLRR